MEPTGEQTLKGDREGERERKGGKEEEKEEPAQQQPPQQRQEEEQLAESSNQSQVRYRVAIVGHSQVPVSLHDPRYDIRIFRAPGATAENFVKDRRLTAVWEWVHDLTIL